MHHWFVLLCSSIHFHHLNKLVCRLRLYWETDWELSPLRLDSLVFINFTGILLANSTAPEGVRQGIQLFELCIVFYLNGIKMSLDTVLCGNIWSLEWFHFAHLFVYDPLNYMEEANDGHNTNTLPFKHTTSHVIGERMWSVKYLEINRSRRVYHGLLNFRILISQNAGYWRFCFYLSGFMWLY